MQTKSTAQVLGQKPKRTKVPEIYFSVTTPDVISWVADLWVTTTRIVSIGHMEASQARSGWRYKRAGDKRLYADRDSALKVFQQVIDALKAAGGWPLYKSELASREKAATIHNALERECHDDVLIPPGVLVDTFFRFVVQRCHTSQHWMNKLQGVIFDARYAMQNDEDLRDLSRMMEPYRQRCHVCNDVISFHEIADHNQEKICTVCVRRRESWEEERVEGREGT